MSNKSKAFEHVEGLLRGAFSTDMNMKIGFGATKRTVSQNVIVFVEEQKSGKLAVQIVNAANVPSGDITYITPDELLDKYVPEPAIYQSQIFPAMRELTKAIARGERHRRQGEGYSAEYEFKNALRLDEHNVRATFGLGLTYLDRADNDKASIVFNKLEKLDAAFSSPHKHMFNEFGIKLRKNQMYQEALKFYARAHKLMKKDDHLLYNISRSFVDLGDFAAGEKYIRQALKMNPKLKEADKLLRFILEKQKSEEGK